MIALLILLACSSNSKCDDKCAPHTSITDASQIDTDPGADTDTDGDTDNDSDTKTDTDTPEG